MYLSLPLSAMLTMVNVQGESPRMLIVQYQQGREDFKALCHDPTFSDTSSKSQPRQ